MGATVTERETTLSQALAAYAGATSGKALNAELVRARVLRSARAPSRRSLRRYSFTLPLVATLAASAAFAAGQPSVRAAVAARLEAMLGSAPAAPRALPRGQTPTRRAEPAPAPSTTTPDSSPESSMAPSAPIAIDDLPVAVRTSTAELARIDAEGSAAAPTGSPASEADAQLEAYRAAHRVHFDAADPGAALVAWDRYLADFAAGSFATDARFNRALCLVRLGRQAEARAALTPFASASPGSYRQAEASALLQGMPAPQ